MISFFEFFIIYIFFIKKREKPLDSDVKPQQEQKTKKTRKTLKVVTVLGLRPLVQANNIAHPILNSEAEKRSQKSHDQTEWKLDPNIFIQLAEKVVCPDVDLFASRLNCQIHPFISWGPDPDSAAVHALTVNWSRGAVIYAFPPFSLVQKTLGKLENDQAEGLLIVPHWPTAVWYLQMLKLLIRTPILLPRGKRVVLLDHSNEAHPLHRRLQLLAVYLSGKLSRHKVFMGELVKSARPGGSSPRNSTLPIPLEPVLRFKELRSPSTNRGTCVRVSDITTR